MVDRKTVTGAVALEARAALAELDVDEEVAPPELEELPSEKRATAETAAEPLLTLGIETSCDETSVAVLRGEREVLSNVISSQVSLHERFGGIVPEIASRAHVQAINPALAEALQRADVTFWDVSVVAVTEGPGLIGSLVVGVASAKAIASVLGVPLIGVNHLEAHLYSNLLEHPEAKPPAVGLIVSGGHTLLVRMHDHGIYEIVGQTLDDAAGEAFDKVARHLGLGFPGGPAIDRLARRGDREAIKFPRPMREEGYDFSFSGLKTAVVNYVNNERRAGREPKIDDVCASFQEAAVDVQVTKAVAAAVEFEVPAIFLCGGVAANFRLREALEAACKVAEVRLFYPPLEYCTDNAAMVACCGFQRYRRGIRAGLDLNPDPNLPLA